MIEEEKLSRKSLDQPVADVSIEDHRARGAVVHYLGNVKMRLVKSEYYYTPEYKKGVQAVMTPLSTFSQPAWLPN